MVCIRNMVLVGVLLSAKAAPAASLISVPADGIRDYLAELFVASFHCSEVKTRHNMLDLAWDILELKTGKSSDDENEIEAFAERVDVWETKFEEDRADACEQAYRRFGANGSEMPDVLYLR